MLVLHFTFFIFSMMLKYEVSIKTIEEIFKKERGDIITPSFSTFLPLMKEIKSHPKLYKNQNRLNCIPV